MRLSLVVLLGVLYMAPPAQAAQRLGPVSLPGASRLGPQELSRLVLALWPAVEARKADVTSLPGPPRVRWLGPNGNDLEGVARVRVAGRASTIRLRGQVRELVWRVDVRPGEVTIFPGLGDQVCFGEEFTGCVFTEAALLQGAPFRAERLCRAIRGDNGEAYYRLTARGRRPILLRYVRSGGSGGENAWVELKPFTGGTRSCFVYGPPPDPTSVESWRPNLNAAPN